VRTVKRNPVFLACVFSILLGTLVALGWNTIQPSYAADAGVAARAGKEGLITTQNAFTSIAESLKPSVVYITAEHAAAAADDAPDAGGFFNSPFGPLVPAPRGGQRQRSVDSGSGVIVRSDGYILTNDHVVAGADRVTVKLTDGRKFQGKVMADPRTDLAVIKISATGLPAAKLGDSDRLKVGQWAIAVGSPFGLTNTLTVGVISGLTREEVVPDPDTPGGVRYYPDLVQTDASINPGNSCGPLVNIDGEVIGINSIIESPSGANAGIGFAIPASTAKFVMDQLISNGKVVRGYLGLEPRDVSPDAAKTLGTTTGALVNSVDEDTPAGKAGIKPMDVVVDIDGKKVDDALALRRVVSAMKPGQKIPMTIVRDGKRQTVQVTIGEAPDQAAAAPVEGKTRLGLSVQELTSDLADRLGVEPGTPGVVVKSVDVDGAAGRANPAITPGDIILKVNGQTTKTVAQFNKAVDGLKSGDTALILLQRKNRTTISELSLD
jgi:serine protease Do